MKELTVAHQVYSMANKQLTHLSLFSGIGGLDLAAEWAGFQTVGQCEWADFPTQILEQHWPEVERWRDIHDLSANEFFRRTGIGVGELTCISGGFPCQPHSVAGMRKSSSDERDLWPEYRRVVGEIKPRWVVAENVRGLLSSEFGGFYRGILRDFADLGYDVGWCCYRAADVGAVHSRERIAIIAYDCSQRQWIGSSDREGGQLQDDQQRDTSENKPERNRWLTGADEDAAVAADADGQRIQGSCQKPLLGVTDLQRRQVGEPFQEAERRFNTFESRLCRTLYGIPNGVDRIKALGNAVVPQQFYLIFNAIAEIEQNIYG